MAAAAAAAEPRPGARPIAELLDTLEGLVGLARRSPTLDGSVPLRVARACVPLLEGNAYGFQLVLTRPLVLRRRLRRWRACWREEGAGLERVHQGAWPRVAEEGHLARGSGWVRALSGPIASGTARGLRLFTGLLVRPERGVWLRVTSAANRRNTLFEVKEQVVADDGAWVPLVLDIEVRGHAPSAFELRGEVACLGPVCPGVRIVSRPIAESPEMARAHAAFYDRGYFEEKKEEVTGKYRRLVAGEGEGEAHTGQEAVCRVATIGSSRHEIETLDTVVTAAGPVPQRRGAGPQSIVFRNEIAFSALFDGHTLALDYDHDRLAARTRGVATALRGVLTGGAPGAHPGSELYLTRYFTPHPPGEPHFFVKPWALTSTPPGWSSLLDGVHGEGYDVMRGVVSTDAFHATPAVFRVHREGARVAAAEGAPLLRVIPVPRSLLGRDCRVRALS